jgi:putative membrane-bound dehydrogenase-like protein
MRWNLRCLPPALVLAWPLSTALGQAEHGFVNTRPSGQPYLRPAESLRRLKVPPGWEVKVFAAEPDIINPIAFTVDERGRLWVVECYEYPRRTPKGKKPRDRIKILEDTTGAGKADKVTVWAEGKDLPVGFDLASGIEVGHGGVFLGAPPYLFFLKDTRGAGKCDRQEVLLRGFGSEDTHETLNTFQWGPDGRLYGLHGIFTQSRVGGVRLNAAVWRYGAHDHRFDIFAEGTSNPWGMDFDEHGQCFLACCVIPHLFHMVPGGTYKRQAGVSFNPYAYGLLDEICDHTHHKESGWAHAGLLVLEGSHVPRAYRGSVLMGSIHGCCVKRDVLRRRGSTFRAGHAPDFLVSGDKNFRPINMRWGPDGSIYLIDWHDQNPCHQAPPDSWDMTHGRVYKIQRKGVRAGPAVDLSKKSSRELADLLTNDNPWWYRTALRLLAERRDRSVAPRLRELALQNKNDAHALRGLWGLYAVGALDEDFASRCLAHESPWVRSWTVRLLGEAGRVSGPMLERWVRLAAEDPAPEVRLQLAAIAQKLTRQDTLPLLHNLMKHAEDAKDPCLPLMIWVAYEPRVTPRRDAVLAWLKDHAAGNPLILNTILPNTIRRLADGDRPEDLRACVAFLAEVRDTAARRRALRSLVRALAGKIKDPPARWRKVYARLMGDRDGEVRQLVRRLAVKFHDLAALRRAAVVARDAARKPAERTAAVRDLALVHPPFALPVLRGLLAHDRDPAVRCEACRALSGYSEPDTARFVLAGWKTYPPELRQEAANLLAGRKAWAAELLAAVGNKHVERTDLGNNVILRILAFRDKALAGQIEKVWGKVRETPAELNALISTMRDELSKGRASFAHGRKVFEDQCAKCHKFDGRGHDVGPILDGAARDIEYLLINVLDPNRVVGQPYFMRRVELKDGRAETGLLAAEDNQSITLKTENDVLKKYLKKDIEGEVQVLDRSVMPEGLQKNMTAQDFRDLLRYVMANPFLTEVAVSGPHAAKLGPAVDPHRPLGTKGVSWARPVVGVAGRIPLPAAKREARVYVAAEVTAPKALRTRLQVGARHEVKVWLNGKVVYQGQPARRRAEPDQAGANVELCPGVNRLLFEVTYQGAGEGLYARLLDSGRKLKYPEPDQPKASGGR